MTMRTDCHRPSAIIPADYQYVLSYDLGDAYLPPMGLTCRVTGCAFQPAMTTQCCIARLVALGAVFAATGDTGKCSVCGARYRYGDVWKHLPTGEYIHVGHDCADKYSLLADRSAYELEQGRRVQARAVAVKKAKCEKERADFLAANPGLESALETDHNIVRDIRARFVQYRSLSPKQVAFVLRLANEASRPVVVRVEEAHVTAPVGRVTFRGTVVSVKLHEGNYGATWKMTVKVTTTAGTWLTWGTVPNALTMGGTVATELRGVEVEITATLKAGRDAHFALMSRPAGRVLAATAAQAAV